MKIFHSKKAKIIGGIGLAVVAAIVIYKTHSYVKKKLYPKFTVNSVEWNASQSFADITLEDGDQLMLFAGNSVTLDNGYSIEFISTIRHDLDLITPTALVLFKNGKVVETLQQMPTNEEEIL